MAICVNCGLVGSVCLCEQCKTTIDLEKLCREIIAYQVGTEINPAWEKAAAELISPCDFHSIAFAISEDLPTPRKEYLRVLTLLRNVKYVPKSSREWLYEIHEQIKDDPGLSADERNDLRGYVLSALVGDYRYDDAESMAETLAAEDRLPALCSGFLGDFYTKTRRYDEAESVLAAALQQCNDEQMVARIQELITDNRERRNAAETGRKEYIPAPADARQKYTAFLASIGIEAALPAPGKKTPTPIPKNQYPAPRETRDTDFTTFVAFDVETTGLNHKFDALIEIGAIRVVNGQVTETAEFTFQELVKPYQKSIPPEVAQLTGISQADVKNARTMWEVFADFMKFVGDDVLLGFNCIAFDSQFLARAGRYANIVMKNPFFDVMRYANQFKEQLDIHAPRVSLEILSEKLEIENPQAHRALADAVTTACVFLKLKGMDNGAETASLGELLDDLDNW